MKKLSGTAMVRFSALAVLTLGIAAVSLYRAGYYDLSFLERPSNTPLTDKADTPSDTEPADTEPSDTAPDRPDDTDTAPDRPDDTDTAPSAAPTIEEQLDAIPTLTQAFAAGLSQSTATYRPGSSSLARVDRADFPNVYFSARGNVTLSLYMGKILYDDGQSLHLLLPDGTVCASDIDLLTPAYLRDAEGHPLFLYAGNYYRFSETEDEKYTVATDDLPHPPFTYNYPADLLSADRELIPFSVQNTQLRYVTHDGQDITAEVEAAIAAGYLILDPITLEISSFLPWIPAQTDTEPADSEPADTEPDDTAPDDTAPDDTEPDDTELTDTEPTDTEPTDTEPSDSEPDDTEPADTEPDDAEPDDTEPTDSEPDDAEPADTEPDDTELTDTEPADSEPDDAEPADAEPDDTEPTDTAQPPWEIYGYPAPDSFTVQAEEITLWGYRNPDGTVAIEPAYLFAADFSEGYATVVDTEGHLCVINTRGRTVINPYGSFTYLPGRGNLPAMQYYALPETYGTESAGMLYYANGWLFVRRIYTEYYETKQKIISNDTILINTAGKEFPLPAGYTAIAYTEGLILLRNGDRYGFMNTDGHWVVQPIYTYAEPYAGGLAVVGYSGGRKGLVDCNGNFVLPLAYDKVEGAADGVICAYAFESGWTIYNVME